jgi:hypothetical protein
MTYSIGQAVFFDAGRICRRLAWAAVLAVAGCTSANVENAAPVASGPGVVGPQDTGSYPNLNIPLQQAAPQFTESEKNAKLSTLSAERTAATTSGGAPPNPKDAAELNKLAKNHGKDTLKAIGATCDPTLDPTCK